MGLKVNQIQEAEDKKKVKNKLSDHYCVPQVSVLGLFLLIIDIITVIKAATSEFFKSTKVGKQFDHIMMKGHYKKN